MSSPWRDRILGLLPRTAIVCHDLFMVWACWQLLHVARYAMLDVAPTLPLLGFDVAVVMLLQALAFRYVGLYRGLWRFASVTDLVNIFKASFIGLGAIVLVFSYKRLDGTPMSVLAIYPFALAALLGGPRLLYRAWKDYQSIHSDARARRVLVLGAGHAAEALVKDLRRSGDYEPVGLLDDSPHLKGAKLQGIPILGNIADVASVARETAAKLLVIAIPTLDAAGMQRERHRAIAGRPLDGLGSVVVNPEHGRSRSCMVASRARALPAAIRLEGRRICLAMGRDPRQPASTPISAATSNAETPTTSQMGRGPLFGAATMRSGIGPDNSFIISTARFQSRSCSTYTLPALPIGPAMLDRDVVSASEQKVSMSSPARAIRSE